MWLASIGLVDLVHGAAFGLYPSSVASAGYDWARVLMPAWAWGMAYFCMGVASWLLYRFPRVSFIRPLMVCQTISFAVFAVSIYGLTINGTVSAITGAVMWALPSFYGLWLLSRPMTVDTSPC